MYVKLTKEEQSNLEKHQRDTWKKVFLKKVRKKPIEKSRLYRKVHELPMCWIAKDP